jgi:PAS domain S-box-containing protein
VRPTNTIGTSVERLDLGTVMKASHAVAGEIVLEKLIQTLMVIALEHAGAERGLLILPHGEELLIAAEARTGRDGVEVQLQQASVTPSDLPDALLHYVIRTQESVILDEASTQNQFSQDEYVRQQRPRSVLCLPLVKQAKLMGVLYLENKLAPRVFTPKRLTMLEMLTSQAAISLENTRLYRDLEEREAKIRRLVDANIMGIFIWNLQGEIIEANDAFLHLLEYSREDVVSGRVRWRDLTPAEWRDRDERAVADLNATGTAQPYQKEFLRKDSSRVPVMIGAAIFEGSKNEGVAFVLDLSEQKRAEDERKRAGEALQKARAELAHVTRVTALGELAASIAHEVNQPLTAIVNNANACLGLLPSDLNELDDVCEALSDIVTDADRASTVLARIRGLIKKSPLQKTRLDLREVVSAVLILARNEAATRRVTIKSEIPEDLPLVSGDHVQLQQVLLNLIMNGMDAMTGVEEEQRFLRISGRLEIYDGRPAATIAVQDCGLGLETEQLDRLFDPFYTTKPQGMGMGLAISRSIIEEHSGRLWAEPNQDPGATFFFSLPAA